MEIRDLFELENDREFQKLNQGVNSFNTLKILRLENHEIRHSNVLSWLLDPKENHSLSDYFLRKTIEKLVIVEENSDNPNIERAIGVLNNSLTESHVFREVKTDENRYIDLVVVNQQLKTVVLIENKFYSTESKNQLDDYLRYIEKEFKGFNVIPVYLTLDGERPSNSNYFIFTYGDIELILDGILTLYREQLSLNVYQFIEDYNQILKEKFYPNQEQILQAVNIYRRHRATIDSLNEEISTIENQFRVSIGYKFEFMLKYKNTINYVYKHGKNILSYGFEKFISRKFNGEVPYSPHPTLPNLLPPEWKSIEGFSLREENYWLGSGLIVWFEKTGDSRLRLVAELGPIEYKDRISLIGRLEDQGISFSEKAKLEKSRYNRFFSKKSDVSKWDDIDDISQAMEDIYDSEEFKLVRKKVETALNNGITRDSIDKSKALSESSNDEEKTLVKNAFILWVKSRGIPEDNYRVSQKNLSFKIGLFDNFKELLGETRENWWWDNGPFLFWMEVGADSIYFTLEVGPINPEKRVTLMKTLKEEGINFRKQGLDLKSKYTRIYSERRTIKNTSEGQLINIFNELFDNKTLQDILIKLRKTYDKLTIR